MTQSLEGKVAIITGGSKGIGKAIAFSLAKKGVHTAIVARNKESLKKTNNEIKSLPEAKKYNLRPSYYSADISEINEVEQLVKAVHKEYGHIDILINNAGIYTLNSVENTGIKILAQTLNINLRGPVLLTKTLLPIYRSQNEGIIVDIGSTAALQVLDQNNTYAASKQGHRTFSQIVDMENPHIKVYRIHPSNTETEGRKSAKSDLEKEIREKSKFLPPEEIGIETVKLLTGFYSPDIKEILVRISEKGHKVVEAVDSKIITKYREIN